MTYGIQCTNPSTGELTLSSEAYTFGYLGKATHVSTTQAQNVDSLSSTSGYSVWSFAASGPIIVAIGLNTGQAGASLLNMSQSGGTWTITVYDGNSGSVSPSSGGTYDSQTSTTDVYVFGLSSSLPAFGVALYKSDGTTLTGDLSRMPLTPAARISLADSVLTATVPALTKPAIIGHPLYTQLTSTGSGVHWVNQGYKGMWRWNGSTTLTRARYLDAYENSDSSVTPILNRGPCTAMLIEANGLT